MLELLVTIILLTLIFGFLIFIHEAGHFLAAKWNGVKVEEFAFGFGPKLLSKKIGETQYKVNAFPLGGYVKMLGDTDGSSFTQDPAYKDNPRSYISKNVWQKMMIVLAGPFINFVGAIVIFFLVLAMVGFRPDPIANIVDYNFIGAEQKTLIYYNYIDEDGPLYQTDIPFIGFIEKVNGEQIDSYLKINQILDGYNGEVTVDILDSKQEIININFDSSELLSEKNPLGLALIDQEVFDRMEIEGYEDRLPVFYNGTLSMGAADNAGLPEAGFVLELEGEEIDSEAEIIEIIEQASDTSVLFTVMDTEYNIDEYEVELGETTERDELFYVAVEQGSAADNAGIPSSAYIISINGEEVVDEEDVRVALNNNEQSTIDITLEDLSGNSETYEVILGEANEDGRVVLGIFYGEPTSELQVLGLDVSDLDENIFETFYVLDYSGSSILSGFFHTINVTVYQVLGLAELIGQAFSGRPALLAESVGTPIKVGEFINTQVVSYSDDIVNREFLINILDLTGLLSATLAFMNMLPIPLVDGGQFLLLVFEKLRGRPLSDKKQEMLGKVGFIFLVVFSIIVLLKDFWQVILSRLF